MILNNVPTTWLECLALVGRGHGLDLTPEQMIKDNLLSSDAASAEDMIVCAQKAGLKARYITLQAEDLAHLRKALPAIVELNNGQSMVLTDVMFDHEIPHVVLLDPFTEAPIVIDRPRLETIWTGNLVLVRRDYRLRDEDKPFGWGLMMTLFLGQRTLLRDLGLGALVLSVLALTPMIFWRIATGTVLTYSAYNTLAVLCVSVFILLIFEGILVYLRSYLLQIVTTRVDNRVSEILFDRLLDIHIDYFERHAVGEIAHDLSEATKIRKFLNEQGFGTLLDSMTLIIFLPVMFAFSPLLTFAVLGVSVVLVGFLLVMLPYIRRATGAVIAAEVAKGTFLYQNLAGIRTVKSLALESRQRAVWDVLTVRASDAQFRVGHLSGVIQGVVRPLAQMSTSGAVALGVYEALASGNPIAVGDLFAFIILVSRVQGPILQLAQLINPYDEARIAMERISTLLSQPREERRGGRGVRKPLQGHVEFANVRFKYAGAPGYAIDGVSFEVPVGTTLGIVGRSGSGKTTVTRLLQRLHADYEGLIKIDGVDVREYDVAHLRGHLGVVLQENFLFSGSIRDNITAAKPGASFHDIVRAARLAGAEEFIDRLPRGYETHIYEGSPNLSGGQRQRLAIARALIVDPRILILDEATSALDPESEAIVNDNIRRIAQGRTVIVISHRLSSLSNRMRFWCLSAGGLRLWARIASFWTVAIFIVNFGCSKTVIWG